MASCLMLIYSYANQFSFTRNLNSFSYKWKLILDMKRWAPRLASKNRPEVIQKWIIVMKFGKQFNIYMQSYIRKRGTERHLSQLCFSCFTPVELLFMPPNSETCLQISKRKWPISPLKADLQFNSDSKTPWIKNSFRNSQCKHPKFPKHALWRY